MDEQIMSWATSRPEVSKMEIYLFYLFCCSKLFECTLFLKHSFLLQRRIGT